MVSEECTSHRAAAVFRFEFYHRQVHVCCGAWTSNEKRKCIRAHTHEHRVRTTHLWCRCIYSISFPRFDLTAGGNNAICSRRLFALENGNEHERRKKKELKCEWQIWTRRASRWLFLKIPWRNQDETSRCESDRHQSQKTDYHLFTNIYFSAHIRCAASSALTHR